MKWKKNRKEKEKIKGREIANIFFTRFHKGPQPPKTLQILTYPLLVIPKAIITPAWGEELL